MKLKHFYLFLAMIGFVGPYYFFISFLTVHGLDGKALIHQLFGTQISTFFALDLLGSSIVFLIYLRQEARRYAIRYRWLYVIALLTVGLSFALPLFLCVREDRLRVSSSARESK